VQHSPQALHRVFAWGSRASSMPAMLEIIS
jgi:hypothetical protein